MAKKKIHFKGEFTGIYVLDHRSDSHGFSFHELKWHSLQIKNLSRLKDRDFEAEKTGDFFFKSKLRSGNWPGDVKNLLIVKSDAEAFSETLHDVVLKNFSGKRKEEFGPIRQYTHERFNDNQFYTEGEIFFSIPDPVQPLVVTPPPIVKVNTEQTEVASPSGDLRPIPDTVINQVPSGSSWGSNLMSLFSRGGAQLGGCFQGIFKLLRWIAILGMIFFVLKFLNQFLSNTVKREKDDHSKVHNVKKGEQRLNPDQDTLAPLPWDYLVDHEVQWDDFIDNDYIGKYTTSTLKFAESNRMHNAWASVPQNRVSNFWGEIYDDMSNSDSPKLDSLVRYFQNERQAKGLNELEAAEMVVAFIQEIPYVLVHDGSCAEASADGGFTAEYHAEGRECLPEIVAGVQSPYEFLHNMQGDCDTRSLLGYTILSKMKIPCSIWVSQAYGHSIMGVALPAQSKNYKTVNGMRHFGVELTARGYRVGMMASDQTDMDNWKVVLFNNL
jgi:hypothetical protein